MSSNKEQIIANSEKMKKEDRIGNYEEQIENNAKNEEQKTFAKKFNKLLEDNNLKHNSFKEAGISETSVFNYRRGKTMPTMDKLEIIANKFGISVNNLLGKSKSKKYSSEQVYNQMGLLEIASLALCRLKHNNPEIEEIDTNLPISDYYEKQLETLSLLIADKNLIYILNTTRRYIEKKQELKELELKPKEDFLDKDGTIEVLMTELIHIKSEIQEFLYKSLDNISENF